MSDGRKPRFKEPIDPPQMKVELEGESKAPLSPEQLYLKRQAEVAQQDNQDFSDYQRKKATRDQEQPAPAAPAASSPQQPARKLNRRSLLTWAAGTAVVGEAVTFGYPMLAGQGIPD